MLQTCLITSLVWTPKELRKAAIAYIYYDADNEPEYMTIYEKDEVTDYLIYDENGDCIEKRDKILFQIIDA